MVQIEKRRKKKGRPSKADLEARRNGGGSESPVRLTSKEKLEVRRSLRRKSFRYNIIDYDEDYLDEDEDDDEVFEVKDEDEDDEVVRREKKVKLVVKLNSGSKSDGEGSERRASRESVTRPGRRGRVAASRGEDDEEREREVKKRRINGRRGDEEEDDDVGGDDDVGNGGIDLDDEVVRFGFDSIFRDLVWKFRY